MKNNIKILKHIKILKPMCLMIIMHLIIGLLILLFFSMSRVLLYLAGAIGTVLFIYGIISIFKYSRFKEN